MRGQALDKSQQIRASLEAIKNRGDQRSSRFLSCSDVFHCENAGSIKSHRPRLVRSTGSRCCDIDAAFGGSSACHVQPQAGR